MSTKSSPRQVEATQEVARVHAVFRGVNERIRSLNEELEPLVAVGEWFCECADSTCIERIEMTQAEYEEIRRHPGHFPVIPGHEVLTAERVTQVVARHSNYLVVESYDVLAEGNGHNGRRAKGGWSA